jgi:hypothetical protein
MEEEGGFSIAPHLPAQEVGCYRETAASVECAEATQTRAWRLTPAHANARPSHFLFRVVYSKAQNGTVTKDCHPVTYLAVHVSYNTKAFGHGP